MQQDGCHDGEDVTKVKRHGLRGIEAAHQQENEEQKECEMHMHRRTHEVKRAEAAGCSGARDGLILVQETATPQVQFTASRAPLYAKRHYKLKGWKRPGFNG
jgi:hypothetical protein